jgi:hypothetical protein
MIATKYVSRLIASMKDLPSRESTPLRSRLNARLLIMPSDARVSMTHGYPVCSIPGPTSINLVGMSILLKETPKICPVIEASDYRQWKSKMRHLDIPPITKLSVQYSISEVPRPYDNVFP